MAQTESALYEVSEKKMSSQFVAGR